MGYFEAMQQSTKKRYRLAILPGDGIGPEVMEAALRVMERVGEAEGIAFEFEEYRIGGAAIDAYGEPLRDADLDRMRACDAALMAAIGGTRWDRGPAHLRPEAGLLKIRKGLGVFANLRPAKIFRELVGASRLKPEVA